VRRFFTKAKSKPSRPLLRAQVAHVVKTFLSASGLDRFQRPETVIAMRSDYQTFVTQDLDRIATQEDILAVVYLKDIECYPQFKTVQNDPSLCAGELGQIAIDYLADQVAKELLDEAAKPACSRTHADHKTILSFPTARRFH
jgi:hypothetical protein